jgi:predicted nucleic-acid-binding Zn-ribbon protein
MRLTESDSTRKCVAEYEATIDLYDGALLLQMFGKSVGGHVEIAKCMEVGLEYCTDPEIPFAVNDVEVKKGSRFMVNIFYSDKSSFYMSPTFKSTLNSIFKFYGGCVLSDGRIIFNTTKNQNMFEIDLKQYIIRYCVRLHEVYRAKVTSVKIIDYGKR